jgi:hypothetical protein
MIVCVIDAGAIRRGRLVDEFPSLRLARVPWLELGDGARPILLERGPAHRSSGNPQRLEQHELTTGARLGKSRAASDHWRA